ncbi:NAD(P)H-dependent oxidoreductase subunit E [Cryptosporangium sp. NPDC048952]|uniref:NAD(P)H-dependent oxidoreductase subunit E n=1 Tax=Cryptosporangium sp. NPDC048952 TaxID=3363961 RepID=UPI00371593E5
MTRTDESRIDPRERRRRRTEPANPLAGIDPQLVLTVRRVVDAHRDWRGPLLPILHALQEELGYVPADATPILAHELNLSRAEVHGVITFYTDFRSEPATNRTVRICRAEACQSVGSEQLVACAAEQGHPVGRPGPSAAEHGHPVGGPGAITVEQVFCLGNCALGPSVEVDGRVLGRVTPDKLREVLS